MSFSKVLRSSLDDRLPTVAMLAMFTLVVSCSPAAESKTPGDSRKANAGQASSNAASIEIEQGGPAEIVRAFYEHLRAKRFREAIFLTNLRPAIEGLTDTELKEFSIDFEAIAGEVPEQLQINGEIITGEEATVTANLPNAEGKIETQPIKLKKQGNTWVIQSVDEETEARIKKEGKQYFYNLRIETHEDEAQKMLERISKAELAYSLTNNGAFADINALVDANLLADDVKTSASTGYDYSIDLSGDKKQYSAGATPAQYGNTGKRSFLLTPDKTGTSRISGKDNGGKPLKK